MKFGAPPIEVQEVDGVSNASAVEQLVFMSLHHGGGGGGVTYCF